MNEFAPHPDSEARAAAWEADRKTEDRPLPGATVRNYGGNLALRGADLAAAERGNIARAAGKLDLTSDEWKGLRTQLGREPGPADAERFFKGK